MHSSLIHVSWRCLASKFLRVRQPRRRAAPRRTVRSRSDPPPDDAPISQPCRRFDDFPRPKRAFPLDGDEKFVPKLTKPGFRVLMERGTGSVLHFSDADYQAAGAKVADADNVWRDSNIVMKVRVLVASRRIVAGRRNGGGAMRSDNGKLATRRRLTHSLPARHTFAMCPAPTCDLGMKRTQGSGPRPPAPSLLGGGASSMVWWRIVAFCCLVGLLIGVACMPAWPKAFSH
jgi:hypothetical protein